MLLTIIVFVLSVVNKCLTFVFVADAAFVAAAVFWNIIVVVIIIFVVVVGVIVVIVVDVI